MAIAKHAIAIDGGLSRQAVANVVAIAT